MMLRIHTTKIAQAITSVMPPDFRFQPRKNSRMVESLVRVSSAGWARVLAVSAGARGVGRRKDWSAGSRIVETVFGKYSGRISHDVSKDRLLRTISPLSHAKTMALDDGFLKMQINSEITMSWRYKSKMQLLINGCVMLIGGACGAVFCVIYGAATFRLDVVLFGFLFMPLMSLAGYMAIRHSDRW
jgi:hypothetical protein